MKPMIAAVAAAGLVVLLGAGPAQSQQTAAGTPCDASAGDGARIEGAITGPEADYKVIDAGDGTVGIVGSGFRYRPAGLLDANGYVSGVRAELIRCDGGNALPNPATASRSYDRDNNAARTFSWSPRFAYNASYAVRLLVTASTGDTRSLVRPFLIDLPASPPQGVRTTASASSVEVTWDPNPEPDIQGYVVQWTTAGDDSFASASTANVVRSGGDPPATRFEHQPGTGEWRYRVLAVRSSPREPGLRTSEPTTAASTARVVAPTTTTAAGGATGGSTAGGSTATTAKPATSEAAKRAAAAGTVDLSSFSKLLDERRKPTTRRAAEADPGYNETLPFQPGDAPAVAAAPPDDGEQTLVQEIISDDGERRRAMAFVASGLLAFVVAFGLRLVKNAADNLDLEPTAPEVVEAPAVLEVLDAPAPHAVADVRPVDAPDAPETPEFDPVPLVEDQPPLDLEPMPVPEAMPTPKAVTPAYAPALDVALPPRRHRRPAADGVGTGDGRRASRRVSPRPAVDRGESDPVVRSRSRGTGSRDRRTSVG